ncbi:MAG: cobalamin biosynthesis protein [Spirochaetaceae bacterium]|jgi:cobalt-precorrin 5A hydrolase|nr:cobalamin biosynthesis protein [Spirochaetaceae bacterium]
MRYNFADGGNGTLKIAFFSFTGRGDGLKSRLWDYFLSTGREIFDLPQGAGLKEQAAAAFAGADAIFFICAAGIAVRTIAPFVRSKVTDPAVIVADEAGKWMIPLLGGHIGGGNELAREVAAFLGGEAVITTATDINGVFAVDLWAKSQNLAISSMERAKKVSARLIAGEEVTLRSDYPVEGTPPRGVLYRSGAASSGFEIIVSMRRGAEDGFLRLIPRHVYVGIGCRKGASERDIAEAFDETLEFLELDGRCVAGIASIDVKDSEAGLLSFCEERGISSVFFGAAELRAVKGCFSGSDFVAETVGVDNVCERAAVLASGNGELIGRKTARRGVTTAVAVKKADLRF